MLTNIFEGFIQSCETLESIFNYRCLPQCNLAVSKDCGSKAGLDRLCDSNIS